VFRQFFSLSFFLTASVASVPALAQSSVFDTPASHAVIMDFDTGLILYEKDARRPTAPASMTKIMTAEMVFDRIRSGAITPDTEFMVSEDAWKRGGAPSGSSTMFLKPKSSVRVEDLLRGVIIQSGNDACIVLAEGIAGSEIAFADMMTDHARKIGLTSATFKNSTGWPHPDHKISTIDLALLAKRSISDYAEFYPLYAERSFEWNGISQPNRNPLLGSFPGADGLKTGSTKASGYGLVASAERAGTRRIVVVNGLESSAARSKESKRLMQAAFDSFKIYSLYKPDEVVTKAKIYMGKTSEVDLVAKSEIQIGLARAARSDMDVKVRMKTEHAAPITKGDQLAELVVSAPNLTETVIPLYAAEDVKEKSAFGRAVTALTNLIRG